MEQEQPNTENQRFSFGNLIIFEHPAAVYDFAPNVDLYRINDTRLYDITLYANVKTFMKVFNENFEKALQSLKTVIAVGYNHVMAQTIQICINTYFSDCLDGWRSAAFFHDDVETQNITYEDGENALQEKCLIIEDMLNFPFIKKIEIPYNAIITMPFLNSLFA
jgi:hypothetical protein